MSINPMPERTINYAVYLDNNELIGTATVDLPELEAMTDTVSGAGIAGEVETPTLGHFASSTLTLNWRTITGPSVKLMKPGVHALTLRSGQQINDVAAGKLNVQRVRIVTRVMSKNLGLGSLEPSATTDSTNEFEVVYIKIFIDDKAVLEHDKYNDRFIVDGDDYLSALRQALGRE